MTTTLIPDASLRTEQDTRLLLGGHPFRVLRLSSSGARTVKRWFRGTPIAANEPEQTLAKRLVDAGLAHPRPRPASASCHVVIPFKGQADELEATLTGITAGAPASVTVVDDGNEPPLGPIEGVTVVRHEASAGPAAARNTGWRHVVAHSLTSADQDPLIAFVDGGVVVPERDAGPSWFDCLAGHFVDADVAAVAPRVASISGGGVLERYESLFSPLDLGSRPSLVGPGHLVTYVPTACLVVRASALTSADGFDESLRFGEDVDLVWRLGQAGQVRYDPSVIVHHAPRETLRAFAEQRFRYATAAARLDQRHPSASAPWKSSITGLGGVGLVSVGQPLAGVAIGLAPIRLLAEQLATTTTPTATAVRLLGLGHGWAIRSFAESVARTWSGVAIVALVSRSARRTSLGWLAAGWGRRVTRTRSPELLALGVVDDLAYGAGAVAGALEQRSIRSLLPSISRWG